MIVVLISESEWLSSYFPKRSGQVRMGSGFASDLPRSEVHRHLICGRRGLPASGYTYMTRRSFGGARGFLMLYILSLGAMTFDSLLTLAAKSHGIELYERLDSPRVRTTSTAQVHAATNSGRRFNQSKEAVADPAFPPFPWPRTLTLSCRPIVPTLWQANAPRTVTLSLSPQATPLPPPIPIPDRSLSPVPPKCSQAQHPRPDQHPCTSHISATNPPTYRWMQNHVVIISLSTFRSFARLQYSPSEVSIESSASAPRIPMICN